MDIAWTVQLFLAVTNLFWYEGSGVYLFNSKTETPFDSHRQARFAAVPPGAPITIGVYLFNSKTETPFDSHRQARFAAVPPGAPITIGKRLCIMKLASAVELFLSIASVVLERQEEFLKSGENVSLQELFLDGTTERSHRQGRIVVVPPMFTQNLCVFGLIFGVPLSFLIPVVRLQTSPDDAEDSEEDEDSRRRQDVDVDDERDIVTPFEQRISAEDESNIPGVAPFALANISAPRSFGDPSDAELVEEYDLDLMHEDNLVTLNNYFDYMEDQQQNLNMDWYWFVQLVFAVFRVVLERSQKGRSFDNLQYLTEPNEKLGFDRQARYFTAIPPGAPITIGMIINYPMSVITLVSRRRLANLANLALGKEGETKLSKEGNSTVSNTTSPDVNVPEIKELNSDKMKHQGKKNKKKRRKKKKKPQTDAKIEESETTTTENVAVADDQSAEREATTTSADFQRESRNIFDDDYKYYDIEEDQEDDEGEEEEEAKEENVIDKETDDEEILRSKQANESAFVGSSWSISDAIHEDQLSKIDEYFMAYEISGERCMRRMTCELASAPDEFFPVSDLLLRYVK
ncbi:unnamed protein product, partial [Notodromas monacha]